MKDGNQLYNAGEALTRYSLVTHSPRYTLTRYSLTLLHTHLFLLRVQHYGYIFNYKTFMVDYMTSILPIPSNLDGIVTRMKEFHQQMHSTVQETCQVNSLTHSLFFSLTHALTYSLMFS